MNKIICEICGTVYPDNATLCPICGYPRSIGESTEKPVAEAAVVGSQSPERVRGGKFSNSNVKKRNQPAEPEPRPANRRPAGQQRTEPARHRRKNDRGLTIAVVVLLVAVIFVGLYIGLRFFWGASEPQEQTQGTQATVATDPVATQPSEVSTACTDIQLADVNLEKGVEFLGKGRAWRLNATTVPENTTDTLSVISSDESVVTASVNEGVIELVSVAPGSATVTISCGAVSKQLPVVCNFEGGPDTATEPTEDTDATEKPTETTEETSASGTLSLNRSDITLSKKGETFTFSAGGGISNAQVTWSSSDSSVVSIENGRVTAVSNGTVTITATYNGAKATCIVRCNIPAETEPTQETQAPDDTEPTQATEAPGITTWSISHSDVSISVGESFSLTVKSSTGETASVSWSGGNGVSISGNTITGTATGTVTVTGTHEGQTFSCIVRVQ